MTKADMVTKSPQRPCITLMILRAIVLICVLIFKCQSAQALSSDIINWDFGIYSIDLPADVEPQEGSEELNPSIYANADKTFFYFPAFYNIDEDFDCVEFLHTVALEYNLDTDELGIMMLTTGKEAPMLFTLGMNDTHQFFVGVYPDYQQEVVCVVAFVVSDEEETSIINYGSTFRVNDLSN